MNLRERAESIWSLAQEQNLRHGDVIRIADAIESALREVRNEALEEALKIVTNNGLEDKKLCNTLRALKDSKKCGCTITGGVPNVTTCPHGNKIGE